MTDTNGTPGKAGKTQADVEEPTGDAYKSQDLTDAGESKPGVNKFERIKAEKDGLLLKQELDYLAKVGWEAIDEADRDFRLRVIGLFYRTVTPGKFMLRMRLANGVITSGQMRMLAEVVQHYGDEGNADITTRQNIQLRGVRIEDVPDIFHKLHQFGLTSVQSGVDNVRNITGSPLAGLDPDELIDTRGLCRKVQDMITKNGEGNPAFTNLPRKFNIAIAECRDNSVHAELNDIGFIPAYKGAGEQRRLGVPFGDGGERGAGEQEELSAPQIGFNVIVGGMFSPKRYEAAVPLNAWVPPDDVVALSEAILLVYRNQGLRANRQKSRLMYLVDKLGIEKFREEVEKQFGECGGTLPLQTAAQKDEFLWNKKDHIGVYPQKQAGLNFAGLHIPIGRFYAQDMFDLARIAEVYGTGEIRFTVEQNLIIPNIPDSRLEPFLQEPLLERFSVNPDNLMRGLVSCTGSQFCGFALIETKNRALAFVKALEAELSLPQPIRIHWTGCPNSCGQPQVADIGLMGTKGRKNGKVVEAVDIWMGGKVGYEAELGERVMKGIPCDDLKPVLRDLLIEHFGATPKQTQEAEYFIPPVLVGQE